MMGMLIKFFVKFMTEKQVEQAYFAFGAGMALVMQPAQKLPLPYSLEKIHEHWEIAEEEYARRGYRTLNLDALAQYGLSEPSLRNRVMKKRQEHEQPVYHARIF